MGLVGAAIMRRSGRRAEAGSSSPPRPSTSSTTLAYWQPLGGGTPGPRFLIPVLPFLAVGLAPAFRHHRAVTLGLAIASGTMMVAGASTYPLVGGDGIAIWAQRLVWADLEHTVLTPLGITDPWLAIAPVLAALAAAIIFAARATPRAPVGAIRPAILALLAWGVASIVTPSIAGELEPPLGGGAATLGLVAAGRRRLGARPAARQLPRAAQRCRIRAAGAPETANGGRRPSVADRIGESVAYGATKTPGAADPRASPGRRRLRRRGCPEAARLRRRCPRDSEPAPGRRRAYRLGGYLPLFVPEDGAGLEVPVPPKVCVLGAETVCEPVQFENWTGFCGCGKSSQ